MGDNYTGTIHIGGKLPLRKFNAFLETVRQSGATTTGDGTWEDEKVSTPEDLTKLLDQHGHLFLRDYQASGGCFDDLEQWLMDNKLAYDRHSDWYYDYDATIVQYRPELGREIYVTSNTDGDRMIYADLVLKARQALNEGNVHAALKFLDDAVLDLKEVTELPKFEIVAYPNAREPRGPRRKKGAHRR